MISGIVYSQSVGSLIKTIIADKLGSKYGSSESVRIS